MIFSDNETYEVLLFISQVVLPTLAVACTAIGQVVNIPHLHVIAGLVAAVDTILGTFLLKSREFYLKTIQEMEGKNEPVDDNYEDDH